jgi:hypothetical protein
MDHLNSLSAYGAHPKDFDLEQVKPVLVNLDIVIKWYLKYKGIKLAVVSKSGFEVNIHKSQIEEIKNKGLIHFSLKKFGLLSLFILLAGLTTLITYRSLNHRKIKKQIYLETIPRINVLIDSGSIDLHHKSLLSVK